MFMPPSPSPEGIEKFKKLYFERFGVELNGTDAVAQATRLLHLVYFGTTPLPETKPVQKAGRD